VLKIPMVDDWYRLSLKYRQFHRASNTVLKDYGYMAIMDYLDSHDANHILEFGHGFSTALFERYRNARNIWGVDDYQGLACFGTPDRDAWEKKFDQEVRPKAAGCTFRRGLLGGSRGADLPDNYFDVVCSVSVLEEVPIETVRDILKHAARLLKIGGRLIGTHDLLIEVPFAATRDQVQAQDRIGDYVAAHAAAGLDLPIGTLAPEINNKTLIENPTAAMICYQAKEPETRNYWGNWATIWTVATKRDPVVHARLLMRA
jgi:SAM-dependent methyltransferase